MSEIALRAGRTDEAAALTELALRSKASWGYEQAFIEASRPALTVPFDALADRRVVVAEIAGARVGFVGFGPPDDPPEMTFLFVEPDHLGGGVGHALWGAALALAHRRGWADFVIAADPFAATRFYEPHGCVRIGVVPSTARPGRMLPLYRYTLDPPPAAPTIGPARDEELGLLPAIEMRAGELFREVGRPEVADAPPLPLLTLKMAHADEGVFVARAPSGVPVGFALVEQVGDTLYLAEISVEPAWARRGLGTRLLEYVAMVARQRRCAAVTLSTFRDVPWNAPYYAARGFDVLDPVDHGEALREKAALEAMRGLDPTSRVMMRRPVTRAAPEMTAAERAEVASPGPEERRSPPDGNVFTDAEPPTTGERFESLLRHGNVHIERILSSAVPEPGTYVQGQAEWVVVLQGRAALTVGGQRCVLDAGDYLYIAPGVPHTVDETETGTLWLAVHIDPATTARADESG